MECELQPRVAPAAHQLEELDRELALADAARAHLDVVRAAAALGLGLDAPVQVAQRLEEAVVEVAPVDEGLHERVDRLAGAVHHAALEPRVALPRAGLADEVVLQRREGAHERPGVAEGAKPHVDAEDEAVGGHVGQQADELAGPPA